MLVNYTILKMLFVMSVVFGWSVPVFAKENTLEDVKKDYSLSAEYIKSVANYHKFYFEELDGLRLLVDRNKELSCQSYVAYSLLSYMDELVNLADINAKAYVIASTIAWKKNEEMQGIGTMVKPMFQVEKDVFDYVDKACEQFVKDENLKKIILDNKLKVKDVVGAWPFKGNIKAGEKGQPLARLKDYYGDLGKISVETMQFFRSIADFFDPLNEYVSISNGSCSDSLLVYSETKGLSFRVINVMSMVMLWAVANHYSEYPEVKSHEKYAKIWLGLFFPGLEDWNRAFQELGARTTDPAVRKAAAEYAEQYRKWRNALDAALASDGLALPEMKVQPQ